MRNEITERPRDEKKWPKLNRGGAGRGGAARRGEKKTRFVAHLLPTFSRTSASRPTSRVSSFDSIRFDSAASFRISFFPIPLDSTSFFLSRTNGRGAASAIRAAAAAAAPGATLSHYSYAVRWLRTTRYGYTVQTGPASARRPTANGQRTTTTKNNTRHGAE